MTEPRRGRLSAAIDWAFRDRRTGAITVAQRPNLPLWLFIVLYALAWATASLGPVAVWLRAGAGLAAAWWAVDEILRGVNPWRRFLGAVTLVGLIALSARQLAS
jgi:hypothetical protein